MPTHTSNINGMQITVPQSFEGILPVSPQADNFVYEIETFRGLQQVVKLGMTVFDIGCNFGVFSTLLAHSWHAKVHAFDGNAEVFPRAKELAASNDSDIIFNQILLGESVGNAEFYSIPSFFSPASTRNSGIVNAHKNAVKTSVAMTTIDNYCKVNKVIPDCIKMDIEGAECAAITGGQETLNESKPTLIIETHGLEILGIMGDLSKMFQLLLDCGYSTFVDLHSNTRTDKNDYFSKYERRIGHLLVQR